MTVVQSVAGVRARRWATWMTRRRLEGLGVASPEGLIAYGQPVVTLVDGASLRIGDRVVLRSDSRYTALGVSHPVVIRGLAAEASIIIGDDVGISGASICSAVRIEIGDGCLLGADVSIFDTPFHPVASRERRYAPLPNARGKDAVRLGRNVFVGTRSVVLPGTDIGEDSVVAAGSVVRGVVPPGVLVGGNPATVIRTL